MLRATWLAQEVLITFAQEIGSVSLEPVKETAGIFQVWLNDKPVWCRKLDSGFPQPKELKQRIRDLICPGRDLGHSDK
jgi:selenoprotein W-related protein